MIGSPKERVAPPLSYPVPATIGVISDTHVFARGRRRLPPEVLDLFRRFEVDLILHAGDVCTVGVLVALGDVAPTLAVQGNGEELELARSLPMEIPFSVGAFSFVLLHGHTGRTARTVARHFAGRVECVVYGHSHIPMIEAVEETILFNPGSATDRRWQEHFGVGLIHVDRERINPELILYHDPQHLESITPDRS